MYQIRRWHPQCKQENLILVMPSRLDTCSYQWYITYSYLAVHLCRLFCLSQQSIVTVHNSGWVSCCTEHVCQGRRWQGLSKAKRKRQHCIKGESNPRRVDGNDPGYHYPINAYKRLSAVLDSYDLSKTRNP